MARSTARSQKSAASSTKSSAPTDDMVVMEPSTPITTPDAVPRDSADKDSEDSQTLGLESTIPYENCELCSTFEPKVLQLCLDIGWGKPSRMERMKGGSFNRITSFRGGGGFSLRPNQDYMLRASRSGTDSDGNDCADVKDQIAVLRYVSQFIPVASIAAFDTTQNNAIGSPYVLKEKIRGQTLESIYYDLPVMERLQIATLVADLMVKMATLKLDKPGRLAADSSLVSVSNKVLSSAQTVDIRPYHLGRYWIKEMPVVEKQPLASFLVEILGNHIPEDRPIMAGVYERLQEIVREMEEIGLI